MFCVLVIGYAPDAVDFTDPLMPPGLDEARVAEGIKRDVQLMHDRGWEAEHLPIRSDGSLRVQTAAATRLRGGSRTSSPRLR